MKYNFEIMEDSKTLMSLPWKKQVMYLAEHGADERFIRALIRTMPKLEWSVLENEQTPPIVRRAIDTLHWEDNTLTHQHEIKEQPKYRPVNEVLADFLGKGKKQAARKELQVRLPYLTAYEQKQIIYAFLDTDVKTDRVFVLKYLDTHFDPVYMKAVEVVWGLHHDFEAAKLLTHYASDEFIAENFEQLVQDYRYLPVRLRMPADYPVDRTQLEWHELIHLCARQHLPITEEEALAILSNVIHLQLIRENVAFEGNSLLRLAYVSAVLWALGELGFQDIVLHFYVENELTKPLFRSGDKDAIAWGIREQIYQDGFCTSHNLGTKEDVESRKLFKHYREPPEDFEE